MTRQPGDRFRALAARIFGAATMDRVVDPTFADYRFECHEAMRRGRRWRRQWLRLAIWYALAQIAVACVWEWLARSGTGDENDAGALRRTYAIAISAAVAVIGLIVASYVSATTAISWSVVGFLVPAAIPSALPVGLTFGIFAGLKQTSRRVARWLLATAVICSAASFILVAQMIPDANQAFRQSMFERVEHARVPRDGPGLGRGPNETTMADLRRQMHATSDADSATVAAFTYHNRIALSFAAVAMVAFALAVTAAWPIGRVGRSIVALSSCVVYALLAEVCRRHAVAGTWAPLGAAWLPNMLFTALAALSLLRLCTNEVSAGRENPT